MERGRGKKATRGRGKKMTRGRGKKVTTGRGCPTTVQTPSDNRLVGLDLLLGGFINHYPRLSQRRS